MKDSKNIEEVNFVSRERIAIECRPDVWEILSKFIPNDIRKNLKMQIHIVEMLSLEDEYLPPYILSMA